MYAFSKLVGAFMSPPGSIVFLVISSLPFIFSRKGSKTRGLGVFLLGWGLLGLLAFSLEPISALLIRPLESASAPLAQVESLDRAAFDGYNAIVVLGADSVPFSPEEAGRTAMGPVMGSRFVYGLRLAKRLGLPLVVTGASPFGSGMDGMVRACERVARDFGVEDVKLEVESKSMTTWENAIEVRKLLDARGVMRPKVVLVTSAWHMKRGMQSFRKQGMEALPAPTDYLATQSPITFYDWLPSAEAMRMASLAFHEYVGGVVYSLKRQRKN